jgi:uncharacterized membrane protein
MEVHEFLNRLDEERLVAEIAAAEQRTSGEIRVWVSSRTVEDPVVRAQQRFEQLGMTRTRERNGVLLYFAPRSQKFAVIGDTGVHAKCGQVFWNEVVAEIAAELRAEHFTEAVTAAVRKIGDFLGRHFPRQADDRNELPNEILGD